MDLDHAMEAHALWKIKLQRAINEKTTLDLSQLSRDDQCDLGKWLHGDGKTRFAKLEAYQVCLTKHAAFHKAAGKVGEAVNAKKYAEASAMLGSARRS